MSATRLALHPIQQSWMKYIAINIHFVQDISAKGLLSISYVNTLDQLADLLTKPCKTTLRITQIQNLYRRQNANFTGRIKENEDFIR